MEKELVVGDTDRHDAQGVLSRPPDKCVLKHDLMKLDHSPPMTCWPCEVSIMYCSKCQIHALLVSMEGHPVCVEDVRGIEPGNVSLSVGLLELALTVPGPGKEPDSTFVAAAEFVASQQANINDFFAALRADRDAAQQRPQNWE